MCGVASLGRTPTPGHIPAQVTDGQNMLAGLAGCLRLMGCCCLLSSNFSDVLGFSLVLSSSPCMIVKCKPFISLISFSTYNTVFG